MLLILAFNKEFIKDMERKNLFTVDNLITLLRLVADATEAATNIIKYFDLDDDVEDDETYEGMEIIAMLKSWPLMSNNNMMWTSLPLLVKGLAMSKR